MAHYFHPYFLATPTSGYPSAASSAPAATSSFVTDPYSYAGYYAENLSYIGLGVTIAGVMPAVYFINCAVIILYEWRERRRRRRERPTGSRVGKRRRRRDEELGFGFGEKPELSAEQTRAEMEAHENRAEMDGGDVRFELPVDCYRVRGREVIGLHELRGDDGAGELEVFKLG